MPMTRKQKRLAVIAALGVVVVAASGLILTALRDQIVFFRTPTEIVAMSLDAGQPLRLGGLVKDGSVTRRGETISFVVTDGNAEIAASYTGIPPDLFKEGQGVVAEGSMSADGRFLATSVLAKHDENYMPAGMVDKLKQMGEWRPEAGDAAGSL